MMKFEHGHTINVTHGHTIGRSVSPEFKTWDAMIQRCTNPKSTSYRNYGARGISVCERWMTFSSFLEDMGSKPSGASLDRVNVNLGYFKENCRWADNKTQGRNRRNNRRLTVYGETLSLMEWSERSGVNYGTIRHRLKAGWSPESALSIKANPNLARKNFTQRHGESEE